MTRSEWDAHRHLMATAPTLAAMPPDVLRNARRAVRRSRWKRRLQRIGTTATVVVAFLASAVSLPV